MSGLSNAERIHAARMYGGFMEEAKQRLKIVEIALSNKVDRLLPDPAISDLCCLQFRKVCETIALGCLVAHGDIKEARTKNLVAKTYRADKLLLALDKLHPDFYPYPCRIDRLPNGHSQVTQIIDQSYMQKKMLKKLYHMMDQEMHVGTLEDRDNQFHPVTRKSLDGILKLFRELLSVHYIRLIEPGLRFTVTLRDIGEVPLIVISRTDT